VTRFAVYCRRRQVGLVNNEVKAQRLVAEYKAHYGLHATYAALY
jgi:hypothetical protein